MTRDTTAGSGGDAVLGDAQNWAAHSHRELYEAVHVNNDPARVGELAQEWTRLGGELAESAQELTERMRGTESGWQGTAASAARSAIQKLVDWNRAAGAVAEQLGDRIAAQGGIMETAKTEMPEPVEVSGDLAKQAARTYAAGDLAAFTEACTDMRILRDRSDTAHQQAVEVMTRMEEESRAVDRATPRFTTPPNPLQEETARRTPMQPASTPAGPGMSAGPSAPVNQPAAAQPLSATPTAQSAAAPKLETTTGGHVSQQHGATPLSAYPRQSGGDAAAKSDSGQPGSQSDAPMRKLRAADGQPDSHGTDDSAGAPRLEDFQPDSTSSQSAAPTPGWSAPHTATPNSGQDTLHHPRPLQGPDGSTAIGGRPVTPKKKKDQQDKRGGSGDSLSEESAQVPPIPSTDGGGGSTGGAGAGGTGDSHGGGGSPQVPPIPSTGGAAGGGAGGAAFAGDLGTSAPDLPSGGKAGVGGVAAGGEAGVGGAAAGSGGGQSPAGSSDQARMGGVGAMPPGAGAQGRGGGQAEERSAKYVEGGPVVEVPGADLPPPVIGEGRKKKQQQDEG